MLFRLVICRLLIILFNKIYAIKIGMHNLFAMYFKIYAKVLTLYMLSRSEEI